MIKEDHFVKLKEVLELNIHCFFISIKTICYGYKDVEGNGHILTDEEKETSAHGNIYNLPSYDKMIEK